MLLKLLTLPKYYKRIILINIDILLLSLALWLSYTIRLSDWWPEQLANTIWLFLILPIMAIPVFIRMGLYRAVIRYIGEKAIITITKAITIHAFLFVVLVVLTATQGVPRSIFLIYWGACLILIGGSRIFLRSYIHAHEEQIERQLVVIYGGGAAGAEVAKLLQIGSEYNPIAFVDDNVDLHGSEIHGVKIYSPERLRDLIEKFAVKEVLLAMPSVTHKRRHEILENLEELPIHVKTLPGILDLLSGKAGVGDITEVKLEDLLGRDVVPPYKELLNSIIYGKSIMVTGAGGSIGSELCRQIIELNPKRLVLFELSEFALYKIDSEILGLVDNKNIEVIPILGSVTNQDKLDIVFKSFNVQIIFHAAAYKHVPLVESNPIEGIWNNIIGTWRCAQAAVNSNVDKFILISTDKAVRPTNVMGASKRMAELVLQALSKRTKKPIFSMVRFGNVLGSSGSVVPLFRKQISKGGPVTVTHPEITRYFMTISEAAQLVLQAGAMGEGGDVFVLDMGEPVKIVDLAKSMIHLSGYDVFDDKNANGGIQIKYTGLRPGEKLYEELLIGDNPSGTKHPKILRAEENELPYDLIKQHLISLEEACSKFDAYKVCDILKSVVIEYNPKSNVIDPIWEKYQVLEKSMKKKISADTILDEETKGLDQSNNPLH